MSTEGSAGKTGDGGDWVEITNHASVTRNVLFVAPEDRSRTYFVAKQGTTFRRAGIVTDPLMIAQLCAWAIDGDVDFPESGLVLG